jgi:tetratricopeptide (TPR) repeat protein/cold shock CspA family protein
MTDSVPTYDSAEGLRKEKKFAEAAEQFAVLWQQRPNTMHGWRYAYCLRKLDRADEAENVLKDVLEKFPDDKFAKSEMGWILYEKELKPAKEESDLGRTLHFANEILKLNPEAFAIRLIAQVVMKVAKGKKRWDVVLEWANKINPNDLSTEARMFDGKRGMSERETWYVGRSKALLELGQFDEARAFAQQGIAEFPDELFLARTAALALARNGKLDEGADELRKLLNHRRADWYVKADLADVEFSRGNHAEAFRIMSDAVSNSQDDEYKLGCFVTLGKIACEMDKLEIAAEHIALAKAVRVANNWSISPDLAQLEQKVIKAFEDANKPFPSLPSDVKELSKICHQRWREGASEGLEFVKGTLKPFDPNKSFAFIKPDNGKEDVFVLLRNIPRNCAREGARLEYILEKSFDQKKNRDSTQATKVRCLNK